MKPYIILILLVILVFANSLQNSFVWEYDTYIKTHRLDLSIREMPLIFIKSVWKFVDSKYNFTQDYYRPTSFLFLVLNYKIWGPNPSGFQLTRIMLHLISAIVLYRIGLLLFSKENYPSPLPSPARGEGGTILFPSLEGRGWRGGWKVFLEQDNKKLVSLMAASIFAVHPLNSEPVVWGADIILGFFVSLSLYLFLSGKRYLSWFTFFLALLSKEVAVMFPFALVILAIHKKGVKKGIIAIIPYIVLVGIFLLIRAMFVDTFLGSKAAQPISVQIFTMAAATLDYIRLLVFPYPLNPLYPARWYTSIFEPKIMIAIPVLTLVSFFVFKIRKDKVMIFLLTFLFFMLAPVIFKVNSFPLEGEYYYIAERFLYVSLMPFSLFVSACAVRCAITITPSFPLKLRGMKEGYRRDKDKIMIDIRRRYLMSGWTAIMIIFAVITISSNTVWRNNFTLFSKIVKESPGLAIGHNNLGNEYLRKGFTDQAVEQFRIAIRLRPNYPRPYYNLGKTYRFIGQTGAAIEYFNYAIKLNPGYVEACYNLGITYEAIGRFDKAIEQYLIVIKLKPDWATPHFSLGRIYLTKGDIEDAGKEFEIVLKINPRFREAREFLERISSLKNRQSKGNG
ncbi:MAG: tetratricopeptide repeat protein [Nitrospirae bacterium]|nr:tetratricopeptide repeat protein [Nitrospirota bacterium]